MVTSPGSTEPPGGMMFPPGGRRLGSPPIWAGHLWTPPALTQLLASRERRTYCMMPPWR